MRPDQDAFLENLYRKYFRKLTIYATAALKDKSKAQDVAQDVFHEAVLHIEALMAHDNPGGWLVQTAKNKIHESERARMRYIHRFLSLDSEIYTEIASFDSPIEEGCISDKISPLAKIERALSLEEFYLLKRLIFNNASHRDVAEELGITVWTSQKRLERIRKKLLEVFPERKKKK